MCTELRFSPIHPQCPGALGSCASVPTTPVPGEASSSPSVIGRPKAGREELGREEGLGKGLGEGQADFTSVWQVRWLRAGPTQLAPPSLLQSESIGKIPMSPGRSQCPLNVPGLSWPLREAPWWARLDQSPRQLWGGGCTWTQIPWMGVTRLCFMILRLTDPTLDLTPSHKALELHILHLPTLYLWVRFAT